MKSPIYNLLTFYILRTKYEISMKTINSAPTNASLLLVDLL